MGGATLATDVVQVQQQLVHSWRPWTWGAPDGVTYADGPARVFAVQLLLQASNLRRAQAPVLGRRHQPPTSAYPLHEDSLGPGQ